ncbi:hypothetical protein LX36DRAFT_727760 [Colletotrichum falcatum]|nr:hypothetical protein LX36DRAFT_727760 [Colletotrichum falcatum]
MSVRGAIGDTIRLSGQTEQAEYEECTQQRTSENCRRRCSRHQTCMRNTPETSVGLAWFDKVRTTWWTALEQPLKGSKLGHDWPVWQRRIGRWASDGGCEVWTYRYSIVNRGKHILGVDWAGPRSGGRPEDQKEERTRWAAAGQSRLGRVTDEAVELTSDGCCASLELVLEGNTKWMEGGYNDSSVPALNTMYESLYQSSNSVHVR